MVLLDNADAARVREKSSKGSMSTFLLVDRSVCKIIERFGQEKKSISLRVVVDQCESEEFEGAVNDEL